MPTETGTAVKKERTQYHGNARNPEFKQKVLAAGVPRLQKAVAALNKVTNKEVQLTKEERKALNIEARLDSTLFAVGDDQLKLMMGAYRPYLEGNLNGDAMRRSLAGQIADPTAREGYRREVQKTLDAMGTTEADFDKFMGNFLDKCEAGEVSFNVAEYECIRRALQNVAPTHVRVHSVTAGAGQQPRQDGTKGNLRPIVNVFGSLCDGAGNTLRLNAIEGKEGGPIRDKLLEAGMKANASPQINLSVNFRIGKVFDGEARDISFPAGIERDVPQGATPQEVNDFYTKTAPEAAAEAAGIKGGAVVKFCGLQAFAAMGRALKNETGLEIGLDPALPADKFKNQSSASVRINGSFGPATVLSDAALKLARDGQARARTARGMTAGFEANKALLDKATPSASRDQAAPGIGGR